MITLGVLTGLKFFCLTMFMIIGITKSTVLQKLLELKVNKAPGPDGIHSYILKACANTLYVPLTILYSQSLSSGVLPDEWKQAHVVPVFKKGQRNQASNYRPISLTSLVVKILESIIRSELVTFLDGQGILNGEQHGFVNRKSCFTNLLSTFEEWTSALDQGFSIDVIFLDYNKAFDSVPHHRLISISWKHLVFTVICLCGYQTFFPTASRELC